MRFPWVVASVACAGPATIEVVRVPGALDVAASGAVARVEITDSAGRPVTTWTPPEPTPRVSVPLTPPVGATWTVRAVFGDGRSVAAAVDGPAVPYNVALEAPAGAPPLPVADGDVLKVTAGTGAPLALVVTSGLGTDARPVGLAVRVDDEVHPVQLGPSGERTVLRLDPGDHRVVLEAPEVPPVRFTVDVQPLPPGAVRIVDGPVLPVDGEGRIDPALPADRLELPPPAWMGALRRLGARSSPNLPATWQRVGLANGGPTPIDVVVRADVVDDRGEPVPAFASRVRDQDDQPYVSVLVRIPPNTTADAVLPLYVDPEAIDASTVVHRRITVAPLGVADPVDLRAAPLAVSVGGRAAPTGFALALATSAVGWGLVGVYGRRFLARTPTVDLVTLALVGAVTAVVGAAFQLVGLAVGAVLGPFAPLLTGIVDDAFRAVLLGTLLTWMPRPGVFTAAAVLGFLLRALALGAIHPVDVAYVGSTAALHEGGLWLAGITRSPGWRDAPPIARWARLTAGLALPNAAAVTLGLATTAMLYRLYYAGWYVAALALVPGFVYVALGAAFAVPIAHHLRRIAP